MPPMNSRGDVQSVPYLCNVCKVDIARDFGRCTNGRCSKCHRTHCTPGGATSPGHNPVPPSNPKPAGIRFIFRQLQGKNVFTADDGHFYLHDEGRDTFTRVRAEPAIAWLRKEAATETPDSTGRMRKVWRERDAWLILSDDAETLRLSGQAVWMPLPLTSAATVDDVIAHVRHRVR